MNVFLNKKLFTTKHFNSLLKAKSSEINFVLHDRTFFVSAKEGHMEFRSINLYIMDVI